MKKQPEPRMNQKNQKKEYKSFIDYLRSLEETDTNLREAARMFLRKYHTNKQKMMRSNTNAQSLREATEVYTNKEKYNDMTVAAYLASLSKTSFNNSDLKAVVNKINSASQELMKKIENLLVNKDMFLLIMFYFMIENRIDESRITVSMQQTGGNNGPLEQNTTQKELNILSQMLILLKEYEEGILKNVETIDKNNVNVLIHNAIEKVKYDQEEKYNQDFVNKFNYPKYQEDILKQIMSSESISKSDLLAKIESMITAKTQPKQVSEEKKEEKKDEEADMLETITKFLKSGFDFKGVIITFFIFMIVISVYLTHLYSNLKDTVQEHVPNLIHAIDSNDIAEINEKSLILSRNLDIGNKLDKQIAIALYVFLKHSIANATSSLLTQFNEYYDTFTGFSLTSRVLPTELQNFMKKETPSTPNIEKAITHVTTEKVRLNLQKDLDGLNKTQTTLEHLLAIVNKTGGFLEPTHINGANIMTVLTNALSETQRMKMQPKISSEETQYHELFIPQNKGLTEIRDNYELLLQHLNIYMDEEQRRHTIPGGEELKEQLVFQPPTGTRGAYQDPISTTENMKGTIESIYRLSVECDGIRKNMMTSSEKSSFENQLSECHKSIISQILGTVMFSLEAEHGTAEDGTFKHIGYDRFRTGMDKHLKGFYILFIKEILKKLTTSSASRALKKKYFTRKNLNHENIMNEIGEIMLEGNEMDEILQIQTALTEVETIYNTYIYSKYGFFTGIFSYGNINFLSRNNEFSKELDTYYKSVNNSQTTIEFVKEFVNKLGVAKMIRETTHATVREGASLVGTGVGALSAATIASSLPHILSTVGIDITTNEGKTMTLFWFCFSIFGIIVSSILGISIGLNLLNIPTSIVSVMKNRLLKRQQYPALPPSQQPSGASSQHPALPPSGGKRMTKFGKNKKQTKKIRKKPKITRKSTRKKSKSTKKRFYVKRNMKRTLRKR